MKVIIQFTLIACFLFSNVALVGADVLLPIEPLPYEQNDFCGEVCIQEALRYLGMKVSQLEVTRAGGKNGVGLENRGDIEKSLRELGIVYNAWGIDSSNSGSSSDYLTLDEHISRIKQQLDLGRPVLIGVKLIPTHFPNYFFDHYMLIIGYTADAFIFNSPSIRKTKTFAEFKTQKSEYTFINSQNTVLGVSFIEVGSSQEKINNGNSGGGCNSYIGLNELTLIIALTLLHAKILMRKKQQYRSER